jgi:hypothetical protein
MLCYRTCLNFLFLGENEVLLMTFGPKWTNRSSATKRIFGIKGRRMTHFIGKEISLNRFIDSPSYRSLKIALFVHRLQTKFFVSVRPETPMPHELSGQFFQQKLRVQHCRFVIKSVAQ